MIASQEWSAALPITAAYRQLPVPAAMRPYLRQIVVGRYDCSIKPGCRVYRVPNAFAYNYIVLPDDPDRQSLFMATGTSARHPTRINLGLRGTVIGLSYRAGCGRHFMGIAGCELVGHRQPSESFWGAGFRDGVAAILARHVDVRERIQAVIDLVGRRLPEGKQDRADGLVAHAAHLIEQHHGLLNIEVLARNLGTTSRTLRRRFKEAFGPTPKTYALVQRRKHALAAFRARDRVDLTALALDLGFADSAHFANDIRASWHVSPSALRSIVQQGHLHDDILVTTDTDISDTRPAYY